MQLTFYKNFLIPLEYADKIKKYPAEKKRDIVNKIIFHCTTSERPAFREQICFGVRQ